MFTVVCWWCPKVVRVEWVTRELVFYDLWLLGNAYDESAQNSCLIPSIKQFIRHLVVILNMQWCPHFKFETCTVRSLRPVLLSKNFTCKRNHWQYFTSFGYISSFHDADIREWLGFFLFSLKVSSIKSQVGRYSAADITVWVDGAFSDSVWTQVCSVMPFVDPSSLSQTYQLSGGLV